MPVIECNKCGGKTNTALCYHIDRTDGKAEYCILRWENDGWVEGCGYQDANEFEKPYADKILHEATEGECE